MFSERFSNIINELALRWIGRRADQLHELDPDKFYVENVRAVLGTPTWVAEKLCELGVRQGFFDQHIEVLHPSAGNAVAEANTEEELPTQVHIWVDEDGSLEEQIVPTAGLQKITYYSLHQSGPE